MERFGWLRRYVSPVFLALLVASFILWYIAKLNYTYTTEQPFTVNVDGERVEGREISIALSDKKVGFFYPAGASWQPPGRPVREMAGRM